MIEASNWCTEVTISCLWYVALLAGGVFKRTVENGEVSMIHVVRIVSIDTYSGV